MSKSSDLTTSLKQEAMLKALQATCGAVKKAASIAQITPQTHYNWHKNDEAYRSKVDDIQYEAYEAFKELVMEGVLQKVKEGNTSVINRSFQTFFGKWAEQMDRANPYRPRLRAKIKYFDKPGDAGL